MDPHTPGSHSSIYGSSPGSGGGRMASTAAAQSKKLLKRIQFDETLQDGEWTVGLLETREQAERNQWSLRVHSSVVELPFAEFMAKFPEGGGEEVPFHRIAWFKQSGMLVWEAEHLRHKSGGDGQHPSMLPGSPGAGMLGLGCSPPSGGFMARLTAAACSGLPPRGLSASPMEPPAGSSGGSTTLAAAQHHPHNHQQQHAMPPQWKPHRLSGTDTGSVCGLGGALAGSSASSSSWCGGGANGVAAAAGGLGGSWSGPGTTHVGFSPRLGTSPGSSSAPGAAGCPKPVAGLEGSGHSWLSGGSCGSSWTGLSPLAAAAAKGLLALPHPGAAALSAANGQDGDAGAAAAAVEALMVSEEPPALADYAELPEECWVDVLHRLGVRELCCAARVNTALRGLAGRSDLWVSAYARLFGTPPPSDWSGPTVKRLCRRSELRASRWLEADVEGRVGGFAGTGCCQLDESKVVSGDGCAVRLWAHESGRRIATLRGHAGRVTAVSFDDERILSGCSQGGVRLWSMDELKLVKALRHHTGPVSATLLLHSLPISGGKDGAVCLWDAAAPNTPLVVLEAGGPVHALQALEDQGYLVTGSTALGVWDVQTAQLLFTLDAPALSSTASSANLATAVAAAAADLDADDSLLLHDGWLLQDDDDTDSSSSDEDDVPGAPPAAAPGGQAGPSNASTSSSRAAARPWTCISAHGNLLAAGRAGSVVLWDVRTQDAVGMISAEQPAGGLSSPPGRLSAAATSSSAAPCVGVQLDDWRLVTGFAGPQRGSSNGGGGGGGSAAPWWQSGCEALWGDDGSGAAPQHSLQVYDIRAAASYSSAAAAASPGGGGIRGGGLWSAAPLMSLPVPNRVTCFQFHGQHLLVGQEGAECCLLGFHPPGSRSGRAAAAWGYGAGSSGGAAGGLSGSYAAAGVACYGASPAGGGQQLAYGASPGGGGGGFGGGGGPGAGLAGEAGRGGGGPGTGGEEPGSGGRGGKKKGGVKVPPKRQTRYPKRATR